MSVQGNFYGMLAVVKYSLRKILFNKRTILTILIILLVGGIMGYAGAQDTDRLEDGTDMMDTLILSFFMPITAMVYGSSIIRDEVEDRSITHIVVSPLNRAVSYMGYYIGLFIALSIVLWAIATAGFLAFFAQKGIDNEALGIYSGICSLLVLGALVYSSLFLYVSVIMKNPLYFGLFYAFIWEGFIGSIPGRIHEVAIKHYIRSIGSGWITHGSIAAYDATDPATSAWVLAVVTLTLLILGMVAFHEKEFP